MKPEDLSPSIFLSLSPLLLRVPKQGLWGAELTQTSVKTRHKKQPTDLNVTAIIIRQRKAVSSRFEHFLLFNYKHLLLSYVRVKCVGHF